MPITTGTVLGRYRLTEKAGVGGMSEVWKAEDETLKRTVAVKVILGPVAAESTFRERFLREARLVAGLEHPNVLPVFDYGTATIDGEEVSYLVMPLVAGGSLKGRVAGPVPPALAVTWLSAIASALDHAHAKGILHRDVKPGNVLMDSQGRPLLADFGLARSAEVSSGLTATGTVLGTPLYMAPEQATGAVLSGRADQYALAVIAFELLAGRVPFSAQSPLAVLHQHVTAPPPPLSSVLAGTAPAVDAVLARGLSKEPADRFSSCGAFVATLGAALAVPGAAKTAPQDVDVESHVRTVISAPAIDAEALAAPASETKRPRETQPDPKRGAKLILAALLLLSAGGGVYLLLRPGPPKGPTALTTSAPATPSSGISSKVNESGADATSTGISGESEPRASASGQLPFEEESPRQTTGSAPKADVPARVPVPRRRALPPLLSGAAHSGDTQLGPAWDALDNARRPGGRLARENFVDAMGTARAVFSRRPTGEARFLDAFSRAGVAFADGRNAEAWQLLARALEEAGPAASSRKRKRERRAPRAFGRRARSPKVVRRSAMRHAGFLAVPFFVLGSLAAAEDIPPAEEQAKATLEKSPRHGEWIDVKMPSGGAPIKTWVVYPERKEKAGVVLVIHEIFGLSDWIRAVADQLAKEGFIAVAPDLLSGKGPGGGGTESAASRDDVVKLVQTLTPEETNARLSAVREWAIKLPSANARSATTGFCWGGSASFAYAAAQPLLNAAVVYYGTAPPDESLAAIKAPVLGNYGGDDARVTATVASTEAAMKKAGKAYEPHVYDGAGHGFLRQQTGKEGANLKATRAAWPRTIAFLKDALK